MTVLKGDVIFARSGEPILVSHKNETTGAIMYDSRLAEIQEKTKKGLKNGLDEGQNQSYAVALEQTFSDDKKQMIRNLYEKIQELKKTNSDPRVVRYLSGELQYMMTKNNFQPETYSVDKITISSY